MHSEEKESCILTDDYDRVLYVLDSISGELQSPSDRVSAIRPELVSRFEDCLFPILGTINVYNGDVYIYGKDGWFNTTLDRIPSPDENRDAVLALSDLERILHRVTRLVYAVNDSDFDELGFLQDPDSFQNRVTKIAGELHLMQDVVEELEEIAKRLNL